MDTKLEVTVVPVRDVERTKYLCAKFGSASDLTDVMRRAGRPWRAREAQAKTLLRPREAVHQAVMTGSS